MISMKFDWHKKRLHGAKVFYRQHALAYPQKFLRNVEKLAEYGRNATSRNPIENSPTQYIYVCVYICMYIYIHMYIYVYIYVYIV